MNSKWMDQDHWNAGLTIAEYVDQMKEYQQAMRRRIAWIRLTPFERNVFAGLKGPLNAAVLTEDCNLDNLMNLPVLVQVAFHAPELEVRIFPRARFPGLARRFEQRGLADLPVFVFYDNCFTEIGVWKQRPALAQLKIEAWEAQGRPVELREAMEDWYDQGLQCETASELRTLLAAYLEP